MRQAAACTLIQKRWRGYKCRQQHHMSTVATPIPRIRALPELSDAARRNLEHELFQWRELNPPPALELDELEAQLALGQDKFRDRLGHLQASQQQSQKLTRTIAQIERMRDALQGLHFSTTTCSTLMPHHSKLLS